MDEPVSKQGISTEQITPPIEIWEQMDQTTRDRVIELFAYSAYKFLSARQVVAVKEDCDVSSG